MKKPSDHLFKLIKSLTKSEKRSFRLNAGSGNEGKKYIAIFDAIDAQLVYDEEALKRKFKTQKWVTRFNSAKEYVYKTLLNSLSIYNQKHEPSYQLADLLMHIRVLQVKGFYTKCQKLIDKGKKRAKDIEDYTKLLELLSVEGVNHPGGINPLNDEKILQEQRVILKILENKYAMNQLYKVSYKIFSRTGYAGFNEKDKKAYKTLMSSDLLDNYENTITFQAKRQFINIHYFYALGNDDRKNMSKWILNAKELFESNPTNIKLYAVGYATTLLNLHDFYLKQGECKQALAILEKLRLSFPKNELKQQERLTYIIEYGTLHNEITTLGIMGNFLQAENKLNTLDLYCKKHNQEISNSIYVRHLYLMAYTYFGAGKFVDCRKTLDLLFENRHETFRKDLIKKGKILLALVYFELGKFDLLEYYLRSVKRFMNRNKEFNELERHLFKLVNHLLDRFTDKEAANIELQKLYVLIDRNNYVPNYKEILYWVESKLKRVSYAGFIASNQ